MTDQLKFFAVWNAHCGYAYDVYPEEIAHHRRSLIRQGERVAGPFDTAHEAIAVATQNLIKRKERTPCRK